MFGVIVKRLLVSDVAGKLLLGDLCLIKPIKFDFKYFLRVFLIPLYTIMRKLLRRVQFFFVCASSYKYFLLEPWSHLHIKVLITAVLMVCISI